MTYEIQELDKQINNLQEERVGLINKFIKDVHSPLLVDIFKEGAYIPEVLEDTYIVLVECSLGKYKFIGIDQWGVGFNSFKLKHKKRTIKKALKILEENSLYPIPISRIEGLYNA